MREHEMVGWHHQLNGQEFEQTPGDSEGQGSLVCCSPWSCSTLGFLVHHQLWELTQTPIHRVGGDILPSHPLSSTSPPAVNLSQNQDYLQ